MALLGLFNKHFMQCGLIKPIQVKHEQNYCELFFLLHVDMNKLKVIVINLKQ